MLSMLIFAVSAVPQAPDTSKSTDPVICRRAAEYAARKQDKPVRAQKLNELPNADEYAAVWRGCDKPLIVRYDIGSAHKKRR
jgi:hypothetical protein